jgi:23S rRNA pseudouridine2604 synthase
MICFRKSEIKLYSINTIFVKKTALSFRNKLQHFLVQKLQISNREAQSLLFEGKVRIDGLITSANVTIEPEQEISVENKVIQAPKNFKYVAFHKPRGIETTLNQAIADNLSKILPFDDVFNVGRLDKASEGLLILTDDGRIYDKILRNEHKIEKEYLVELDKPFDYSFIERMSSGIEIMGKITLPCQVVAVDERCFKIVLIQGLNRQIRRMCYKLGYEVTLLKRVRIGNLHLGDLKSGDWRFFELEEVLKSE